MAYDRSDYQELYAKTAHEYLDAMTKLLDSLSIENPTSKALEELHRSAHSLKGMSYAIGFTQLATFTRIIELFFYAVMQSERKISSEEVGFVKSAFQTITMLVSYVSEHPSERDASHEISELKKELQIEFAS